MKDSKVESLIGTLNSVFYEFERDNDVKVLEYLRSIQKCMKIYLQRYLLAHLYSFFIVRMLRR